ncbi:AMP-binding protein [Hyphomicrobium sp. D-2]|uniref:AMP-binding protein n=1 Tax=Hyphomicrobium sp. D-2 TaxID=3041621 RepID=UPI0024566132|nr:AMP-binding protein [Hyphomicrobium sp. D-2]MDH4980994.1 AMP-binding protein [Hyphomicrobium sp. D-2]
MTHALAYRADSVARARITARSLDLIEKWATEKPRAWALLHKKSVWHAYTWQAVAKRVADLRGALARRGVADGARFAVSGQLDAQLLLVALAAHTNGATVIPIDRYSDKAALEALLQSISITHAYVPDRKTLATWLSVRNGQRTPVPLFSAHTATGLHPTWNVQQLPHDLATLAEPANHQSRARTKSRPLQPQAGIWVDEGTEWNDGLADVISAWLETGNVLAAPETSLSATRDRFELQPARIIASNARKRRIQAELNARLYPPGTWLRTIADVGLRSSANPLTAWIGKRIARLNGLPSDVIQTRHVGLSPSPNALPSIASDPT